MKGDSMKSYEVYEATLTFNDENEEVNICDTKNSYSDPELNFFSLLLLRSQRNRKKSCSAYCRHNASSITFVFVLSRVISKRKTLLPWWSPTDKWKIVNGWLAKNNYMDGKNRHMFCKNLLVWNFCILSVPTFILQNIHKDKFCSHYLYWQYFHHFIEKVDSFLPPKIAYPESFNM